MNTIAILFNEFITLGTEQIVLGTQEYDYEVLFNAEHNKFARFLI